MLRDEVWRVNFDPSLGGEMQKTRPAAIVSNNASNRALNRIQVVPITSRKGRVYPCEAIVSLNGDVRKAMADQIATVSKLRSSSRTVVLSESDLRLVDGAIRVQPGLNTAGRWRLNTAGFEAIVATRGIAARRRHSRATRAPGGPRAVHAVVVGPPAHDRAAHQSEIGRRLLLRGAAPSLDPRPVRAIRPDHTFGGIRP
jgi:mRNA interferase MazF